MAMSMQDTVINPNEDAMALLDCKIQTEDRLAKMMNNHNILLQLLEMSYELKANGGDIKDDNFF